MLYCTVLYCTVLYYSALHRNALPCALLLYTIVYYTIQNHTIPSFMQQADPALHSPPFKVSEGYSIGNNTPKENVSRYLYDINVELLHKNNTILGSRAISCNISTAAIVCDTRPAASYLQPNHSSADIT